MFRLLIALYFLVLPAAFSVESHSLPNDRLTDRVTKLERKQSNLNRKGSFDSQRLEQRMDNLEKNTATGIGLFISGILCALWAQFTRRSAWLWFFFGALLAPIALIALVWKNAVGLASGELRHWTSK